MALGIENLVSAMAGTMLSALEPIRDVLPGVNAGSLVAALTPERIGSPLRAWPTPSAVAAP